MKSNPCSGLVNGVVMTVGGGVEGRVRTKSDGRGDVVKPQSLFFTSSFVLLLLANAFSPNAKCVFSPTYKSVEVLCHVYFQNSLFIFSLYEIQNPITHTD